MQSITKEILLFCFLSERFPTTEYLLVLGAHPTHGTHAYRVMPCDACRALVVLKLLRIGRVPALAQQLHRLREQEAMTNSGSSRRRSWLRGIHVDVPRWCLDVVQVRDEMAMAHDFHVEVLSTYFVLPRCFLPRRLFLGGCPGTKVAWRASGFGRPFDLFTPGKLFQGTYPHIQSSMIFPITAAVSQPSKFRV